MAEHLAFLRTHKAALRLSLNAMEDLLVNGSKPPIDRGVCKHLLAKIDRKLVESALARDALKNDLQLRTRFLAGIVRLNPDAGMLLRYLEALAELPDRRDAAQAFALTVDRMSFDELSNAQMTSLLGVIMKTFDGHDRVQALFGLLGSDSFAAALDRTLGALAPAVRDTFAPLRAAQRVVVLGQPLPVDESERAQIDQGVALLLAAPDRVLRSYPLEVRVRLADFAIDRRDRSGEAEIPRSLLDSIPHQDPTYARLGALRADQLLAMHEDEAARALLSQIVQSHPNNLRAARRLEALSWPRAGRVAIAPDPPARLLRAFWLDGSAFVWARIAPRERAHALSSEAQLQACLLLTGVAAVLAHGVADDGKAFVAISPGGRPFDEAWIRKLRLSDALLLALEGVRILHAVAAQGVELPDAALHRFLFERGSHHGLRLADFEGAIACAPAGAAIAHGPIAAAFCREVLKGDGAAPFRAGLPRGIEERLRGRSPLPTLARALSEHAAHLSDH